MGHDRTHASLIEEATHEARVWAVDKLNVFRGDAACNVQPSIWKILEGDVADLASVYGEHHLEGAFEEAVVIFFGADEAAALVRLIVICV
jgi:hypothetical protein